MATTAVLHSFTRQGGDWTAREIMIPERWQRLQQLFEQAVTLDHDARRQFLTSECADDSALASEVIERVAPMGNWMFWARRR
jgi:hypothetical protein